MGCAVGYRTEAANANGQACELPGHICGRLHEGNLAGRATWRIRQGLVAACPPNEVTRKNPVAVEIFYWKNRHGAKVPCGTLIIGMAKWRV